MKLSLADGSGLEVSGLAIDHRKITPGTVFGAFPGAKVNGESFIAEAVAKGAIAVVARPEALVVGAKHIADPEPRRAFAQLAAQFYQPVRQGFRSVPAAHGRRCLRRRDDCHFTVGGSSRPKVHDREPDAPVGL